MKKRHLLTGAVFLFLISSFTPVSADTGWTSTDKGLVYIDPATGKNAVGLVEIDSDFYYFDEISGIMLTGLVNTGDGTTYYFGDSGEMLRGWRNIGKNRYYFLQSDGSMVKGDFFEYNEKQYYLGTDGRMVTGLRTIGENTYYFSETGEMLKGWRNIGDSRYYFLQDDGTMVKGHFVTWNENKYYMGTDGKMTKGFCTLDGKTYYFSETGEMLKGWRNIGGSRYYFLQEDGVMVQNHFVTWNENKYYLGPDGKMVTGLFPLKDKVYYFSEKGEMMTGWRTIDGNRCYFLQSDGTMVKGHTVTWNDYTYYLNEDGILVTDQGDFVLNGQHYRIDSDGKMLSSDDSILYLCNNNGSINKTVGVKQNSLYVLPTIENPLDGTFVGWSASPGIQLDPYSPTQSDFEPGDTVQVNGTARIYSTVLPNKQDKDPEGGSFTKLSDALAGAVFLGDSGFRFIDGAIGPYRDSLGSISFITNENADLEWLLNDGYGTLVTKIDNLRERSDKPVAVVFHIGLWELGKEGTTYDSFLSAMSQLADALQGKNCRLYFVSLLPLNPRQMELSGVRKQGNSDPSALRDFNTQMSSSLPEQYTFMDLYSWMMTCGYRSDDGLHYSDPTSRRILEEMIKRINSAE